MNLDGVYLPSFNKSLASLKLKNKKINIIGSAHNIKEMVQKKKQGADLIFLSPVFNVKKSKNYLDIFKFNLFTSIINRRTIALGGINSKNIKKIKILNCYGLASISFIKKYNKISRLII